MIRKLAVLSALALGAAAAPVAAQLPLKLGVQAGATVPTGDLADLQESGYNVGLLVEVKPPLFPIGLRGDLTFHELASKDVLEDSFGDDPGALRILNANANAILSMPGILVSPYLIGGIGWYRTYYADVEDSNSDDVGFNAGAGLRFGLAGFGAAVEARYHRVSASDSGGGSNAASFIPVSFVLTF